MARVKSVTQSRAVHPESDWLWAAVEMGWPAVALLLAGLLYGLRRCLPLGENLRAAAAVCAVAFALHGLVDVSGHRAGAAWPALFLFGIAMNPARPGEPRAWVAPLFRIFGGVLAALAAWWLASDRWDWGRDFAPTTRTLARLDGRLQKAKGGGDYPAMIATATEALRIAPLQWDFYFLRACAEAASHSTAGPGTCFRSQHARPGPGRHAQQRAAVRPADPRLACHIENGGRHRAGGKSDRQPARKPPAGAAYRVQLQGR